MKWALVVAGAVCALAAALWLLPPLFMSGRASNDRSPQAGLKIIAAMQADFRGNDRDGDKIRNYWRADIAGLQLLQPEGSTERIQLIGSSLAAADGKPTMSAPDLVPAPSQGWWFRAMRFADETSPDPDRFAAIMYPASAAAGTSMYIISHENTIYFKAFGGIVPELYPVDLLKEGWSKLD